MSYLNSLRDSHDGRVVAWNLFGFCGMAWASGFWLRFGRRGYGLSIRRRKGYRPLFSERTGRNPIRYVGPVVVKRLLPLRSDDELRERVREAEVDL